MPPTRALMFAIALAFPSFAEAGQVASEAEACAMLTEAVPAQRQRPNAPADYYCELDSVSSRYYVFAFRSRHPEPPGAGPNWVGSNLFGWFAVRRLDGAVLEWDIANLRPGAVLSVPKGSVKK